MSIRIAGQRVLIDVDDTIKEWIERFLDGVIDDPFFSARDSFAQSASGSSRSNNFYFESALPALPKIELNRIQWPVVGTCRFARGLFAVDAHAMAKIALEAWGVVWNPNADPSPDLWAPIRNIAVDVQIISSDDPAVDLSVKMFVLHPLRVSDQCWIVRLVDRRYFLQSATGPIEKTSDGGSSSGSAGSEEAFPVDVPDRTWEELCDDLVLHGIDMPYTPSSEIAPVAGVPDVLYAKSNTALLEMADSIAYSLGCRPVVQVRENANSPALVKVQCQTLAVAATIRNSLYAAAKVTGGSCNLSTSPSAVDFISPAPWSYYSGLQTTQKTTQSLTGYGPAVSCRSIMLYQLQHNDMFVHSEWDPQGIYNAYHGAIAGTIAGVNGWNRIEHAICFPGIVEITASGHDDYIEYDFTRHGPTTRVVSLPVTFFPKGLLSQHPSIEPGEDDDEASFPPCPWFSTPRSHTFGTTTGSAEAGEYLAEKKAWRERMATVQIVDSALGIPGTEAKFRKVRVQALNCQESSLDPNDTVRMYFGDQMILREGGEVAFYTGWIISGDTPGDAEGMPAIEGPVMELAMGGAIVQVEASTRSALLGTNVLVIDLSGCVLDEGEDLVGVWVWAQRKWHSGGVGWVAFNRCCV